jgi:hypothetical protein
LLKRPPLGQLPSLHPLRSPLTDLVRGLSWYYGVVRLPMTAHHRLTSSDFPMRPPFPCEQRQPWDLPIPVQGVSVRARGLRPRRARAPLALSMRTVLPSVTSTASAPWNQEPFHGSIPGPHVPLSTLRLDPRGLWRMTRGRCGSLHLHRMTLSFTTPRRFSSALSDVGSETTCAGWSFLKKGQCREKP